VILLAGALEHPNVLEIVRHPWFVSAFAAGGLAQVLKFLIASIGAKRICWCELLTAGGMPSGHAALVSALSFAVGFTDGFDAPYAMVAVGLGLIVIVDAVTLRREAGEHARILNHIVSRLNNIDPADRLEARQLEERLGHSCREALVGVLFGGMIAFSVCLVWDFWK